MLAIGMPFIQWDICLIIETCDSSGIYIYIYIFGKHGARIVLHMLAQYKYRHYNAYMYNASMALQSVSQNDHDDGTRIAREGVNRRMQCSERGGKRRREDELKRCRMQTMHMPNVILSIINVSLIAYLATLYDIQSTSYYIDAGIAVHALHIVNIHIQNI